MGNNCILGANSVLSQSMPDNCVFIGNPAQFLCTIEDYGDVVLSNNAEYPRELEQDRKKLDLYIKANLPYKFKKARMANLNLNKMQYEVTQNSATEPPFSNEYYDNFKEGILRATDVIVPLYSLI